MNDTDFVTRSVAMQLGRFSAPYAQSDAALDHAMRAGSGTSAALPRGARVPLRRSEAGLLADEAIWTWPKSGTALRQIAALDPQFGFVVDMQDRRHKPGAPEGAAPYPTFCFNRITSQTQHILWPLPINHDLDSDQFLAGVDPDAVPWHEKKPMVIWRGNTVGQIARSDAPYKDGPKLRGIVRKVRRGEMTPEEAAPLMAQIPRFRAVSETLHDPRFDMGFVDGGGFAIRKTPLHAPLEKPRVTRQYMQTFRYIAVLRGVDVGSSLYWTLNSGSVALVMDTPFDTFASAHFRPWEHYIPFKADLSDLYQNLDWAEANPDACRDMVAAAASVCRFLARRDLRDRIARTLIETINDTPIAEQQA